MIIYFSSLINQDKLDIVSYILCYNIQYDLEYAYINNYMNL